MHKLLDATYLTHLNRDLVRTLHDVAFSDEAMIASYYGLRR
jgi:hypothetical protein